MSSLHDLWSRGVSWAGLAAGPAAWGVNLQGNFAAVPWVCANRINFIPVMAVVLAAIAIAGGLLSWRAWRVAPSGEEGGVGGTPTHLLAGISILTAALFAIDILSQGSAALVLTGCER